MADLRYRLDLLNLDIEAAEAENRNRLRVIRKLYFVRTAASGDGPAPLYQLDQIPPEVVPDGRRWRVKRIDQGGVQLMGGGEVVGSARRSGAMPCPAASPEHRPAAGTHKGPSPGR